MKPANRGLLSVDTFEWARGCGCKELVLKCGPKYVAGMKIRRIMDFASGTNEEITKLAHEAEEYYSLDEEFLPIEPLFFYTSDYCVVLNDSR